MARPRPASAAAMATTNSAITWPACRGSRSHTSKVTRFRLTAASISSTDISTRIVFRRASTPYTPAANSSAASTTG
jgi:hypothetical protein